MAAGTPQIKTKRWPPLTNNVVSFWCYSLKGFIRLPEGRPRLAFVLAGFSDALLCRLFARRTESERCFFVAHLTLNGHRSDLREFLVAQLDVYSREPEKGEKLAYDIAGLMSTRAIMNLIEGDPYEEALALAGEFELPPVHRDKSSTWEKFATLVRSLPDDMP